MERTLGIDIGTSGTKVVLLDRDGRLVDEATSNYPMETPEPGWAQQDPAIWWSAAGARLQGKIHLWPPLLCNQSDLRHNFVLLRYVAMCQKWIRRGQHSTKWIINMMPFRARFV